MFGFVFLISRKVAQAFALACPSALALVVRDASPSELNTLRRLVMVWRERAVLPEPLLLQCEALVPPDASATSVVDARPAQLASLLQACSGTASRALAEHQRALADWLFREAQIAVQELEKTEAELARAEQAKPAPEKKRKIVTPVQELLGNPKLLQAETLALMNKMTQTE